MCYIAKWLAEVIIQLENQQDWIMYKGMSLHNHLQLTFKQTKTIIKGLLNYTLAHFSEHFNWY